MWLRIFLAFLLLAVLSLLVYKSVDLERLGQNLVDFPKITLILVILLTGLITLLKAYRFFSLLEALNIKLPFLKTLKVFIASQALTPLPGGEAGRAYLFKKEFGVPIVKLSGPVLSQAYIELMAAASLAVLGSFFFKVLRVPAFIFAAILVILAAALISSKVSHFLFRLIPQPKLHLKLLKVRNTIKENLVVKDSFWPNKVFVKNFGLAMVANLIGGIIVYLIARGFQLNLDPLKSIFVYSSSIAVSAIATIVPGGLGFTEGGLTGVLVLFKILLPEAVAVVLIFRLVTFILPLLIGLTFLLWFYHKIILGGKNGQRKS